MCTLSMRYVTWTARTVRLNALRHAYKIPYFGIFHRWPRASYFKGVVPLAFRKRCEWFADKIDWCSLYIRNIRDTCVYHSVSMRTRPHLSANALSSVPRIFELHKTLVADDIRWYPHYIRNTFAIRARYIRDTYARLNQCIRDIRNYPQLIRN